ncbi:MAG: 3-hydroxyisobutyryl-CoA hydrolase [Methylocystis sp.]|uniref:3-hydroxyisobutyryl-CoA hydrolase n=1 Tax=Methylocystis sp. TaxID=1911079 RepID=UPI003DA2D057
MTEQAELLMSRSRRLGRIRLNRPKALNSLTLSMVRLFTEALKTFARDDEVAAVLVTGEGDRGLCAGGDIRALYDLRDGDKTYYRDFWREEYELNALIASYAKPYVVVMDGLVMGGGVGVSAHGSCRIVTERTRLAMPETGIGFIPDVGGTWLLSRAGGAGVYMALSGATVSGADALAAGLADWSIDSGKIAELSARLHEIACAEDVRAVLAEFNHPLEPGELSQNRAVLDNLTAEESVEEVLTRLAEADSAFARRAAAEISKKSPTSLKVTQALLRRATNAATLRECLIREFRAACRLLERHDLYEGIRAAIIDKDKAPKWRPATLQEVSLDSVNDILRGVGSTEPFSEAV